ncbi:MAG TPA: hypothetical protein GXX36_14335 [Clostridiaceae bacterium]|nr:hypothetical protein [Clostridiaceae bacterium]
MKKGKILVVLTLLLAAAVIASIGTGAIDVFTANRSVSAKIVDDTKGFIGLSTNSPYASFNNRGTLEIKFASMHGAEGFNPDATTVFKNLFTVTNQSDETVYVWLEAGSDYSTAEHYAFDYRVQQGYTGVLHRAIYTSAYSDSNPLRRVLISDVGRNFKNGRDGENAYMELAPGQSFDVEVDVATLTNYGGKNTNLDHTLIIRADKTAPVQKYPDPFK